MRRRLNLVFLAMVLVSVLLLAGGVHLLHGVQVEKSAVLLKQRAEKAGEAGDDAEALLALRRYIGFRPDDAGAQAEYALLRAASQQDPGAQFETYLALERALRLDDGRDDVRRKAAEVAMRPELGRYGDAKRHLEELLSRLEDGPEGEEGSAGSPDQDAHRAELDALMGRALEGEKDYTGAAEAYEDALRHDPGRIDAYPQLADLYRNRLDRPAEADRVMGVADAATGLVAANPDSHRAYLERARYRRAYGLGGGPDTDAAALVAIVADVRRALELAPSDPEVLVAAAEVALDEGHRDEALAHLARAKEALAGEDAHLDAGVYEAISQAEIRAGDVDEARESFAAGIEQIEALPERERGPEDQEVLLRLTWSLANLLIDSGKYDEAETLIDSKLRDANLRPGLVGFLEGRILVGRGEWQDAAKALDEARLQLASGSPELAGQVDLLLGACYSRLGNPDRALEAYRRAVAADRMSVPGRLGLAATLAGMGKPDEAVEAYRPIVAQVPALWLEIARLLFNQEQARPPDASRNWGPVEAALGRAEQALADGADGVPLPDPAQVALLRGRVLYVRAMGEADPGRRQAALDRARDTLAAAVAAHPDNLELPAMLVALVARRGDQGEAQAELDRLERSLGDTVAVRLARAAYWASVGGEEANRALGALEEDLGHFDDGGRVQVLTGLVAARGRIGDRPGVLRLIDLLKQIVPEDPAPEITRLEVVLGGGKDGAKQEVTEGVRTLLEQPLSGTAPLLRLFDLAIAVEDAQLASRVLDRLKEVEGEQGASWRVAEARTLLLRAGQAGAPTTGVPPELARARAVLEEAASLRPSWALVPLTRAQVELQAGDRAAAIAAFERARGLGARSTEVALALYRLYTDADRTDQADALIRSMQDEGLGAGDDRVARLAAEGDLRHGADPAQVLERARAAVPTDSPDYRDHLWLARFLLAAEEVEEAESEIRRAVELGGDEPAPWVALVRLLAARGRPDEARAEIAKAGTTIDVDRRPLALAQCHAAVGDAERAEALLDEAIAARPADPALHEAAAGLALSMGRVEKAAGYLDKVAAAAGSDGARRILAVLLAASGDPEKRQRALELAGAAGDPAASQPRPGESPEELRARAQVLALQVDHESKRAAIRLLEQLAGGAGGTPNDQLLLAQLHVAEGQWPRARDRMVRLLAAEPDNPRYLEQFARWLLVPGLGREADPDAALPYVERLERIAPDTLSVVELRARHLAAEGRAGEAVARVLEPYASAHPDQLARVAVLADSLGAPRAVVEPLYRRNVERPGGPAAVLLLARFLEAGGDTAQAEAEATYRRYATEAGQAEAVLALAGYLGRRGRLDEALAVCEDARATCPPQVTVQAMIEVLFGGSPDRAQVERVGRALESALARHPDDPILLFQAGNLRSLQGHDDEAERWFRRSVAVAPGSAGPLNNLAWFLAMKGPDRASEADELVGRAIAIEGLTPDLLDTRAVARIRLGRHDEAVADLDEAIAKAEEPQPLWYAHRAWAHQAAGRIEEARADLERANRAGLAQATLPPLEKTLVERLRDDLGGR